MFSTAKKCCLTAAAVAVTLAFGLPANAGVVINIFEDGPNVQSEFSGTIDLDATLSVFGNANGYNGYLPDIGAWGTGGLTTAYNISSTEWTRYGPGGFGNWDASSGDNFVLFTNPVIAVPVGYVSGDTISGTTTKNNVTLADLGMDVGSYTTIFENAGISDFVTINVLPAPGAMALLGLCGLVGKRRRRSA